MVFPLTKDAALKMAKTTLEMIVRKQGDLTQLEIKHCLLALDFIERAQNDPQLDLELKNAD